jgi:hypothetical protein
MKLCSHICKIRGFYYKFIRLEFHIYFSFLIFFLTFLVDFLLFFDFDDLIQNPVFLFRFLDLHFDLQTIAGTRSFPLEQGVLSVVPEGSISSSEFIYFFDFN